MKNSCKWKVNEGFKSFITDYGSLSEALLFHQDINGKVVPSTP